ncbi:MAG: hypothetical protein U0105_03400 [Candidatus Obscuribacterales bacterium]
MEEEFDPYADLYPPTASAAVDKDVQDNFVEPREPAELIFCIILSAVYAGLARYCWEGLWLSGNWKLFLNIEGFFITIALLALLLGLRPYLSPSSLQLSGYGIKYRAPYWPQRRSVNWTQVVRLYISPGLILVLYRPQGKDRGLIPMIIQSDYLADKKKVPDSIKRFSPVPPVILPHANLLTRTIFFTSYGALIIWILWILRG